MPHQITKSFILERETKGAVRYVELDDKGQVATYNEYTIGTVYIRKNALTNMGIPPALTLIIKFK